MRDKQTLITLVKEINAPLIFLPIQGCGQVYCLPSVHELQDLGIARLSLGSGVMKTTLAIIKNIANELPEKGTYNILQDILTPLPPAAMAHKWE